MASGQKAFAVVDIIFKLSRRAPMIRKSQDSFEVGAKTMLLEKRLRWNTAFFYSDVRSLQRTVVTFDPEYGFVRITSNAGDATIWGIETNIDFLVSPNLTLSAAYGYTNGEYDEVVFRSRQKPRCQRCRRLGAGVTRA